MTYRVMKSTQEVTYEDLLNNYSVFDVDAEIIDSTEDEEEAMEMFANHNYPTITKSGYDQFTVEAFWLEGVEDGKSFFVCESELEEILDSMEFFDTKYIVQEQTQTDYFSEVYDRLEDANAEAESTYDRLNKWEKERINVVVYSVTVKDLDEEAIEDNRIDWTAFVNADIPEGAFEYYC